MTKFLVTILLSLPLAFPSFVNAAGGTVSVTPPYQEVAVNNGDLSRVVTVTATNTSTEAKTFQLSVEDVSSFNDRGGINLAVAGRTDDYVRRYGLSAWTDLDQGNVTIESGKSAQIKLSVRNDTTLIPGGHYGVLVIAPVAEVGSGQNPVNITPTLTSLILLTKIGGETRSLKLDQANLSASPLTSADKLDLHFKNDGNVHLIPRGMVTVTDPLGHEVSRGVVNEDSAFVFPGSSRKLITPFQKEDFSIVPGIYTVEMAYRYVGTDQLSYYRTSFFYLGWPLILLITALAIAFRLKWYRNIRWPFKTLTIPGG